MSAVFFGALPATNTIANVKMAQVNTPYTSAQIVEVHQQLARTLASPQFLHADRMSRFLSYVVDETLAGRSGRLSQYAIAADVFDRDDKFDPAIDAVVRVEAGRLRSKLREYSSEEGRNDKIVISLPKRSYAAAFQFHTLAEDRSIARVQDVSTPILIPTPRAHPIVAVLPFDNMSSDPEQDYFADGLTEDIITDLSRLPGMAVISRHSTFVYKNEHVSVKQVCEELEADYVLEGSVRKTNSHVRVNAQLIEGNSGTHVWAERYDRKLADIFKLQDELNSSIVQTLKVAIEQYDHNRLPAHRTHSIDAYDYVLRGLKEARSFTKEGSVRARYCFERAIELDPEYALAFARLSLNHVFWWISGWSDTRIDTTVKGLELAQRSVALNDGLALGHTSLSWAYLWSGRHDEAIKEGETAIDRDPNEVDALERHSLALSWSGEPARAVEHLNTARRLNPHEPYYFPQGTAEFYASRYEEAINAFKNSIERHPNFRPAYLYLAAGFGLTGNETEAKEVVAKIKKISPDYNIKKDLRTPLKSNEDRKRFIEGLQIAGLS